MPVKKWDNETYHFVEGKPKMLPRYNQWFDMKQRCFESLDQASAVHTQAKREFAIKLADKWKGHIDQRAYQALLNKYGEIE